MTTHRDAKGRPLVAVTGLGVVTSLGQGKETNWQALTAGQSGIRVQGTCSTVPMLTRTLRR